MDSFVSSIILPIPALGGGFGAAVTAAVTGILLPTAAPGVTLPLLDLPALSDVYVAEVGRIATPCEALSPL